MGANSFHCAKDFHAIGNLSEDGVLSIEMREGGEAEEELRSVGVRASVSHGEDSRSSVLVDEVLIVEFVSVDGLSTSSVSASEISTLSHESGDNSVVLASLEVEGFSLSSNTLFSSAESTEVLRCDRGIVVEINSDSSSVLATNGDVEVYLSVNHPAKSYI